MSPVRYRNHALDSMFQPIFSLCHRRTVGFEALLRPRTSANATLPPMVLIELAAAHNELRALDNLCQTLHIDRFAQYGIESRWLFLNLDPKTITRRWYDDGTLLRALDKAGLSAENVVIEILEGEIEDEPSLLDAIAYFRNAGALVALDDFGSGHSNFDRIWRLAPDIIKLDRGLIVEAEQHRTSRLRRILPNLVSLVHEAGSLVLCEGVETEAQAMVAMESDVDFVQGFYFGRPDAEVCVDAPDATRRLFDLTAHHVTAATVQESIEFEQLAPYVDAFRRTLSRLQVGTQLGDATGEVVRLPRTARVYLLDANGEEISHVVGPRFPPTAGRRAAPIANSAGGVWYRRKYFKAAVNEPGRLQFSKPYLSSTGGYMCTTLSIAAEHMNGQVACCDVAW